MFDRLCRWIPVVLLATAQVPAHAEWPEKTLTMILPYAAGSGVDVVMRPVADAMGKALGQAVVVDNRPSAGGIVGTQALVRAAPDGYTFGYGNLVTLAINKSFFQKLPYDPQKDLRAIGRTSSNAYVIMVRNDLPVSNFQELLAYARRAPRPLSFGSGGVGSAGQLAMELVKSRTGIELVHVPYKTGMQAIGDMVNGQLDLAIDNVAAVLPMLRDGRVRAIAVTSKAAVPVLPNVAPLSASGLPDFDVVAWGGLVAPAGTPDPVIDKLNAALRKAMQDPAFVKLSRDLANEINMSSPQELTALIAEEIPHWAKAVKLAGVQGD